MSVSVKGVGLLGIEAKVIDVQVQISNGLPSFTIVGLADKAVSESKERVRAAFVELGISLPPKKIVVNLAPADLPKEGSMLDLPIAIGILTAIGLIPKTAVDNLIFLGELGLNGSIQANMGVLNTAVTAIQLHHHIVCGLTDTSALLWVESVNIYMFSYLQALIAYLKGELPVFSLHSNNRNLPNNTPVFVETEGQVAKPLATPQIQKDFKEVKGQRIAKRALMIAASGRHHSLFIGPPGSGKTMLMERYMGILPPLTLKEALEVGLIRSVAKTQDKTPFSFEAPFRAVHHSASLVSVVGGGRNALPGEVSLSHKGVLFLDELPEFSTAVIDALRQPIEKGEITISRAENHITYPSEFQLMAAMNPCKCGFLGLPNKQCNRVPQCGKDYQQKISGPIIDRFDLQITVHYQNLKELMLIHEDEYSTEWMQRKVQQARKRQLERFKQHFTQEQPLLNGDLSGRSVDIICVLEESSTELLHKIIDKYHLSHRKFHKLIKVARTIADLEENYSETIQKHHLTEALNHLLPDGI